MGKFGFEARFPIDCVVQSKRLQVLAHDLASLRVACGETDIHRPVRVKREDLVFLKSLGDTSLSKVLSFDSSCDPHHDRQKLTPIYELYRGGHRRPAADPNVRHHCDFCDESFPTKSGLFNHKRLVHQQVNHRRAFIKKPECPACGLKFSNLQTARNHFENLVCPESMSFAIPSAIPAQVRGDLRDLFSWQRAQLQ